MKLTNRELTSSFMPALQQITALRTNSKVAFNSAKTIKAIASKVEEFELTRKNLLESRCEKREDGKPKIEKNEYVFIDDKIKQEAINMVNEASMNEIEVEIFPISISDIDGALAYNTVTKQYETACISGHTILALKDFIQE